jgi:hypothetical protein
VSRSIALTAAPWARALGRPFHATVMSHIPSSARGADRPLASMAAQEMDMDTVLSQAESMANPSHESFLARSKTLVFRVSLSTSPADSSLFKAATPCTELHGQASTLMRCLAKVRSVPCQAALRLERTLAPAPPFPVC